MCLCLCVWCRTRAIHVETPIRAHTLECLYTRPAVTKHLDSKRCAWRMYIAIVKNYGCKKLNVCKRLPLVPWCPGALVPWPLPMHVQHRVAHVIGQALLDKPSKSIRTSCCTKTHRHMCSGIRFRTLWTRLWPSGRSRKLETKSAVR